MSNEEENVDVDGVSDTEADGGSDYSDSNSGSDSDSDSESDYSNIDSIENVCHTAGTSEMRAATGRIPKRKVAHHNALERSRRNDLTEAYDGLAAVLTAGDSSNPKLSRDAIIEESLRRIMRLAEEEKAVKDFRSDLTDFEKRMDRLRAKMKEAREKHGLGSSSSRDDVGSDYDSPQLKKSGEKHAASASQRGQSTSLGSELASVPEKALSGKKRRISPGVSGGKKIRKSMEKKHI